MSELRGKGFENEVADLYRLMGYEVKQNVLALGHQIDLILTYTLPGGSRINTAVECKYIHEGNLNKNDVMENINAMVFLRNSGEVQNLIIVTTNGFAKNLWDVAKAGRIELLTFRELQHQMVRLDDYLRCMIENFETDEISRYYVNLVAQDDEKTPEKLFDPLEQYIHEWVKDDKKNHLSILGEYGTGKTSFCKKLAHDMAVEYSKNPLTNRVPILISLRDYSKVMSVRQLITDLLVNEYGFRGINFPLFERMNKEGLFVLIFDGFDEMAQKVIFDVAFSNFSRIAELAKPEKSKVILTCRTEFFRTHEREREILIDIDRRNNFDIIYLRQFDDKQIREFLKKRVPLVESRKTQSKGWEYYYRKIHEVFDLSDLAKRPVLLDLIVKYLPQLIEKGGKINASTLYKTTIQEELKRRLRVGATIIQRDDRIKLMKLLAAWMYNNDRLYVHYEQIPELLGLKNHFDLKTLLDIEYHLNDFLTCSFLNRDTDGNYRFSHKSLVDFLVADKFTEDTDRNYETDFLQKPITYEVVQFIKDLGINKRRLYDWIRVTRERPAQEVRYLGANAITVLNEIGEDFSKQKFDFSKAKLDNANFDGQNLTGLKFRGSSLKNANLNNTVLKESDFSFADLRGVSFEKMGPIYAIAFSSAGKLLAGAGFSRNIKLWDTTELKEVVTFNGHVSSVLDIAFSPDGKYLASASHDNTVIIWDMKELKEITRLRGHSDSVRGVAFSPDGKYLASAGQDCSIVIWDMKELKEITKLERHTDSVLSVAFSPDNKYLVSGSSDKNIMLWNTEGFEFLSKFVEHRRGVADLAFSGDGELLASASDDETIRLWHTDPKKADFGSSFYIFEAQINCQGMLIENSSIGDVEKRLLLENGAVGDTKQRQEYKRGGVDIGDKRLQQLREDERRRAEEARDNRAA